MTVAAAVLLELHCAAMPFLRRRTIKDVSDREQLRRAVIAVLREADALVPAELLAREDEALAELRRLIALLKGFNTRWPDVVAIVNATPPLSRDDPWRDLGGSRAAEAGAP